MLVTIVNHEWVRRTMLRKTQTLKIPNKLRKPPQRQRKAIGERRERLQSGLLVAVVGTLLVGKAVLLMGQLRSLGPMPRWFWLSYGFSAGFGLLVWAMRSATAPAAAMGAVICLNILLRQGFAEPEMGWRGTALPSLVALFLLTFAATRFGRKRKEAMGTAEPRSGRRASQVVANLGVAGLCAVGGEALETALLAASIAALAEATADTVSSEMGQALAGSRWGRTLLITTGKPVAAGTDGGVSVAGTVLGMAAALVVVLLSPVAHSGTHSGALLLAVFAAGCAGLFFDSVLGATVERKGWLGNDLVNFSSTVLAAVMAYFLVRLL
jgi:uncharacterized protein (TIGR00297 family)